MAQVEDHGRASFAGWRLLETEEPDGMLHDVHITVDLGKEWTSHWPFGLPNRHTSFQPDRFSCRPNTRCLDVSQAGTPCRAAGGVNRHQRGRIQLVRRNRPA
jgi:hypothetical protein